MAGLATLGFVGTNYNNVCNKDDWTRIPVLAGQCFNAADEGVKLNKTIAMKLQTGGAAVGAAKSNGILTNIINGLTKITQNISNGAKALAESNKFFDYTLKTVNFVKKNINPLIVASSTTKVLLAKKEDRKKTFFSEGGCVAGMFLGEGWMKKNLDKYLDKLPIQKKWLPVIKGVVFVCGSITSSIVGQKLGKNLGQAWDTPLGKTERAAKEQSQSDNIYSPLNLKA